MRSTWNLLNDEEKNIQKVLKSKKIKKINKIADEQNYWISMNHQIKKGKLKSWAYYFLLSIWKNNGLTITPNFNLIKNLGCDSNLSTNQHDLNLKTSLPKNKLEAPLKHPKLIKLNERADNQVFYSVYKKNIIVRLSNKIKKITNFLVN